MTKELKVMSKPRRFLSKWLNKILAQEIQAAVIAERVRIFNELFNCASVRTIGDGNKTSQIASWGVPKLEKIILVEIPDWYKAPEDLRNVLPKPHPVLGNL